ncbi:Hypothetical predicted protein, partial [Olea europaea subsp. europaea]
GFAASWRNAGEELCHPPVADQFQQMLFQQQQVPVPTNVTNLDRLMETLTISIPSQNSSK